MGGSPRAIRHDHVRVGAREGVGSEEQPVVSELERCQQRGARDEGGVVVLGLALGHPREHVGRDDRVVHVARDAADAAQLREDVRESESGGVDENARRLAAERLEQQPQRAHALAQQRRHGVAGGLNDTSISESNKANRLRHFQSEASTRMGSDFLVRRFVASVHNNLETCCRGSSRCSWAGLLLLPRLAVQTSDSILAPK
mmetsp:Transcript_39224/g.82271  ORF Transcript_39224/g.82271 Transcript_39224/m.82271 type:complete len:201 (-) Transcript_39224:307-909(-)